ncbi:MAG: ribosome assembly RNA-binding protein YhbY [Oscillospiraceae bacterium]|nr:ribosome assembly RNA-binding protein YhbY [Oscillospiraceae bacterium]
MTGKQRAYLRGLANGIDAKYQIGKDGIDDETIKMVDLALEANELIKIKILENALLDTRSVSDVLCEATGANPVQCIGNKVVLYRESEKNKTIILPKK